MSSAIRLFPLLLVVLQLAGCGRSEVEREEEARKTATPVRVQRDGSIRLTEADRAALNLEVARVSEGTLPSGALRFGKVQAAPQDEVVVAAPFSGRITMTSPLAAGARVSAGMVITAIVPSFDASERVTLGVQAADIEGQIQQLEKEVRVKDAQAARMRKLAGERIASAASEQEASADAAAAHARLDALRRERVSQRTSATRTALVRAPIAGTLSELDATPGHVVREGDALARIVRSGARFIDLPVGPDEPAGDSYAVLAGKEWFPATLVSRGGEIEPDGFRHDRIAIADPAGATLLPGLTVTVRVGQGASRGIVVPDSAIVPTARGDLVYIEVRPDTFAPRIVHIAERAASLVRIDQGLSVGEVIAVRGVMGLYGESVRSSLE